MSLLAASMAGMPLSQAQTPGERQAAVALGDEALGLYEQGKYQEAYDRFAKANDLLQAPTLLLFMARCQSKLGKLASAAALYDQVAATPLDADATPQFREARDSAIAELTQLAPRVPKLTVRVSGAEAADRSVTLDGAPLDPSQIGTAMAADPGRHTAKVTASGFRSVETEVVLREGASSEIDLELVASGGPIAATAPEEPAADGPLWPAGVAFGLGAAALGVGIVTGVIAMNEADDIKSRCVDNHCLTTDEEAGDGAETLATVSTIGFVVAGVGLAAGVVLAVWRPGGGSEAATEPSTSARSELRLGPGSLTWAGTF